MDWGGERRAALETPDPGDLELWPDGRIEIRAAIRLGGGGSLPGAGSLQSERPAVILGRWRWERVAPFRNGGIGRFSGV